MQDYYDEQEIDLKDLLYKVAIHLKQIVIVAIISGLLFAGYAYYKTNKADKIAKALIENKTEALELYENDITEQDVFNVEVYENNIQNQNRSIDYLNNSIKLNINDSKSNSQYNAYFTLTGRTNCTEIINYINSTIINNEIIDDFVKKLNIKNESIYFTNDHLIKELISITSNSKNNTISMSDQSNVQNIVLSVISNSQQESENLGNLIVDAILANKNEILETFAINISLTNTNFTNIDIKTISDEKTALQNQISTLSTTIKSASDSFNDIQSRYYLYRSEEVEAPSMAKSIIKYSIIGILIGGILMCVYYTMTYIFNGKLHTSDDLKWLNIVNLGIVYTNKDHNKFYKKIFNKEYVDLHTQTNIINKKIEVLKKNNSYKNIVLVSSLSKESLSNTIDVISSSLNIKKVYYQITNNIEFVNEYEKKNVVLLEVLEESRNNNIINETSLLKDLGLNVLGCIVIDNE